MAFLYAKPSTKIIAGDHKPVASAVDALLYVNAYKFYTGKLLPDAAMLKRIREDL